MSGFFVILQRVIRSAVLALATIFMVCGAAHADELKGVRFGPNKDTTRIVFDIAGAPEYQVFGDDSGEGRLYVDFADLKLGPADTDYKPGKGHIDRYGFASSGNNGVRAVLEFKKTAKIKEVFVLEPKGDVSHYRLVIDLQTADKAAFMASLPRHYGDLTAVIEQATAGPAPDQTAQSSPPLVTGGVIPPTPTRKAEITVTPEQPVKKLTVVIDPGHGGRDPGSQGQSGTLEKVVTLAAALELEGILKRNGYNVVLTRESDSDPKILRDQRSELARREALARAAKADLFISLHSDALEQNAVRGASVYTLSEEGTARSANLAKSKGNYHVYNIDLEQYDTVVGGILLDKAQDSTMTRSSQFAEILIANLSGKTPMLNRSHRKGDLRVLLAADVPAVLLEMAFISNVKDEANLISPVWRTRAMTAVADAIDQYFEQAAPQRHASLPSGAGR